jgi:hypothetical protein
MIVRVEENKYDNDSRKSQSGKEKKFNGKK